MAKTERVTVDLTKSAELVVIYLGLKVNRLAGVARILKLGPQIKASVAAKPAGLLLHEGLVFSLWPLH